MGVTVRMLNSAVILGFLSVCLPPGWGQYWGNFNLEQERQNKYYQKPKWYSQDYYDDYNEQKERTYYPVHKEHHNLGHEYGYGHGHRYRSPAVTPLVFLAPLAGIAALYAMAFVNSNPALLTLATISGRKKRSLHGRDKIDFEISSSIKDDDPDYLQEVGTLSRFITNTPGLDLHDQRDQLMSNVLQCSSIGSSQCLDALVCEYSRATTRYNEVERDTITMVLYHLLASSYIDQDIKSRIRIAAGLGKNDHCSLFSCSIQAPPLA